MAAASLPVVSIDAWSDLACPWCYVGKRRLDKAIQGVQGRAHVEVDWHPYIIDPATRPRGETFAAYNERRWGGSGWTQGLKASGRPDGATFSDWKWWPNTFLAHRLVAHAARHGRAGECKDALFVEQYERGGNISEPEVLLRVGGQQLGLPGVAELLAGEEGEEEVLREDTRAKQSLNISGVPYFVVGPGGGASGKRYALSGAQSVDAFERAKQSLNISGVPGLPDTCPSAARSPDSCSPDSNTIDLFCLYRT